MAVTSQLTSLETFESAPTYNNIGSGGGASDNTDVFIEGSQSGGRRVDNATDKGFMATISSTDLSGADEHVKVWVYCFHWSAVTAFNARLASGASAYDNHTYPTANIPVIGGWIPLWVDVSRTPDSTGTSGLNEAAVTDIGAYISIGNVGGAGDNFIIDEIMHGTSGYLWDGAGGSFGDFRTYEGTNVEGVFLSLYDADLCFARLEIGSATATGFTDAGFTIVFPDQPIVSTTFMGLTVDLQNASTAVDLSNGALVSGDPVSATNRPDLLVTGTSGTLDLSTMLLNGLRTIELTSACTMTDCVVLNTGVVDATTAGSTGPDCSGTSILDSTVAADASAFVWDVNQDPDTKTNGMTFEKGANAHHAIELGTNRPTTVTLRNLTSTGFNASDAQNDSFFYVARTSGDVTINVIGGTGNFSYKSAGANVSVVLDPVTTLITVKDENNANLQNARVLVRASDGTGDLPYQDSVTITRSATTATVSHTAHGMANNDWVWISGADQPEYNGPHQITNVSANAYDYTVSGSPTSPATGTITATGVVISALTNASGQVSASASYSVNQPVRVHIRKSTSTPLYKASSVDLTIDKTTGLTHTQQMVRDD